MKFSILLIASLLGAEVRLITPETPVMTGQRVSLQVLEDGRPLAGIAIAVTAPTQTVADVTANPSLNVRSGPGTANPVRAIVYRGETVLLLGAGQDGWCQVVTPAGAQGFASCEFLSQKPFGQPAGATDDQGRLETTALSVAPATLTLTARRGESAIATATLRVVALEFDRSESVAPGIGYRERRFVKAEGDGPFTMQILEVDPQHPAVNVLPARARDRAIGREATSSMAKRLGATAAVNAGYFVTTGAYAGQSSGVYQISGSVIAGTGTSTPRSALIWCREENFRERFLIDTVGYRGRVTAQNGQSFNLFGLNANRGDQDLKLYQPVMGPRTLTSAAGVEAILDRDNRVIRVEDGMGNAEIPADGSVLSGAGAGATWLRQNAIPGSQFRIEVELTTTRPASETGCAPVDIVGGGPRLVRDGRRDIPDERFGHENTRNPRTVVASTRDGRLWFLTLDGRQASSAGMRLDELADELIAMGAVEAINLDGGGSSAIVVRDQVRNSPSDGVERTVSDSLLIYSIPNAAALAAVGEKLAADPTHMNEEFARCFRDLLPDRLYADMLTLVDALPRGRSSATERLLREAASELRATRNAEPQQDPGAQLCSPAKDQRTGPRPH